jgi:hypothetical protein
VIWFKVAFRAKAIMGDERTRGSSGRDNRMFVEAVV